MYKIIAHSDPDDPHAEQITQAMSKEFPRRGILDPCELLDMLTVEVLSSNHVRLGPRPSPENLVAIRAVIANQIKKNAPITFVVPWGSEKPNKGRIDVAEVLGLKTIASLHQRIHEHYEPGAHFNIRIEDASAPHLFFDRPDDAWEVANRYSEDFVKMIKLLDLNGFITPIRESYTITHQQFSAEADQVVEAMEAYLNVVYIHGQASSGKEKDKISSLGWKGDMKRGLMEHYLFQYEKLYPYTSFPEKMHILARYLAGSLTRSKLKLRGDNPDWQGIFLELSFTAPIKGTEHSFPKRIYYRTVPSSLTGMHIAPWRARGYIHIENDEATPKIASFTTPLELNPFILRIEEDGENVCFNAPYVLSEH